MKRRGLKNQLMCAYLMMFFLGTGQLSCTNSSQMTQKQLVSQKEVINYSGLYKPSGSDSTTGQGGVSDLPHGYIYSGPEPNVLKSIDPASEDEKALTTKYFEVCEKLLGEFPLPEITCDDPDMVPLPISHTINGETKYFEASDLPPGPPRVIGMEKEQLAALSLLGDSDSNSTVDLGPTRIIKKNRFSNTVSAPSTSGMDDLSSLENLVKCDVPTPVFRDWKNMGCIAGSSIRRVTTTFKGDPVDWVYICQKNRHSFSDPHLLDDIGMIAHNRGTGATCFYAGTPRATFKVSPEPSQWSAYNGKWPGLPDTDSVDVAVIFGRDIPPPSSKNPESVNHWGMPVPVPCTYCHSAGPWISVPFVNVSQKDGPVLPPRKPGMMYHPVNVATDPEIASYLKGYKPVNPDDDIVKTLANYPKKEPKRLTDPRASACTSCHHIGSDTYSERFAEMSLILSENFDLSKLPWRSQLYFGNSTDPKKLTEGHNNRLLGLNTQEDYPHFSPLPIEDYRKTFEFVLDCGRNPEKCEWSEHWTLDKVAKNPENYLIEQCSSCHHSGKGGEPPSLEKPSDFIRADVRQRIWARMNDTQMPMPKFGNVEAKVLLQLKPFLTGRQKKFSLLPEIEQIKAHGIDRNRLKQFAERSAKLRAGKSGKDLRVVVVGSGPVGGMAAFKAISEGADPEKLTVVEMRDRYIRQNIVSAPQDPDLPVNWPYVSPLLGGGQSLNQIERAYRAVVEELGVNVSKSVAARVCGNSLYVVKPLSGSLTRRQRQELYQKKSLCDVNPGSVTDLTLDSVSGQYKVSAFPFDVLLVTSGAEGRQLYSNKVKNDNVPEPFKDIFQQAKEIVPDLTSLYSAAWLYKVRNNQDVSCYEDFETNGFKNTDLEKLKAVGISGKPHSVQASPLACYLIADVAGEKKFTSIQKRMVEKDFLIGLLGVLWPQYSVNYPKGRSWPPKSEDVEFLPNGQQIFENNVMVAVSNLMYSGTSFISCEGDCALSPFYALKDNIHASAKNLESTGKVIRKLIQDGFADQSIVDSVQTAKIERESLLKTKSWRHCYEIGKRALPSKSQKIGEACKYAVEQVFKSSLTQNYSDFPEAVADELSHKKEELNHGRSLMVEHCLGCHNSNGPRPIEPGQHWQQVISSMNERYLPTHLVESESKAIASYLESLPAIRASVR